jgi:D-alanyl-D-alanine carboxypeptidase (penicillin-binding protein 5/6)
MAGNLLWQRRDYLIQSLLSKKKIWEKNNVCSTAKYLILVIVFICIFSLGIGKIALGAEVPQINAKGAILMDAETGDVLWEKNGYQLYEPASTTKILTALVVLDMCEGSEETVISSQAAAVGESSANLQTGEVFTVENLLKGALVKSANDACFALGEAVAGSEPLFVHWMNLKAFTVGAYDTKVANTNGLPGEEHFLSAYDLAVIARVDLQNREFREIVGSKYIEMAGGNYNRTFKNSNKLLFSNDSVIGIKTGTTDAAGACLVSAMERDGRSVIAVVLNSPDRYGESLQLLNYGIENFQNIKYITKGERLGYYNVEDNAGVFVDASCDGVISVNKEESAGLDLVYRWRQNVENAEKGDVLGTVVLKSEEKDLKYVNLLAEENFDCGGFVDFWQNFGQRIKRIFVK